MRWSLELTAVLVEDRADWGRASADELAWAALPSPPRPAPPARPRPAPPCSSCCWCCWCCCCAWAVPDVVSVDSCSGNACCDRLCLLRRPKLSILDFAGGGHRKMTQDRKGGARRWTISMLFLFGCKSAKGELSLRIAPAFLFRLSLLGQTPHLLTSPHLASPRLT